MRVWGGEGWLAIQHCTGNVWERQFSSEGSKPNYVLLGCAGDWHLLPPLCPHQQSRVVLWNSLCRVRGGPKWACWVDHRKSRGVSDQEKKPRKINSFVLCVVCLFEGRFD